MAETPIGNPPRIRVDVHFDRQTEGTAREELRTALSETPRWIPAKFFYDQRGSELFELITELPEYYQTRTEGALLLKVAPEIAELTAAEELVELGSGAATKTRILLEALQRAGSLRRYLPFDVSETTVHRVAEEIASENPELEIYGVVGDFLTHIEEIPAGHDRLVILLGGTIGNFLPEQARAFLSEIASALAPGDHFLLGVDLIKPVDRLEAAYNDARGVTAEFNLNILNVVNGFGNGDFDPRGFRHRAFYDCENDWIDMRLVSKRPQTVRQPKLDLEFDLAEGEEILTEISAKYDREKAETLLRDSGFEPLQWYTDEESLFGLFLARLI